MNLCSLSHFIRLIKLKIFDILKSTLLFIKKFSFRLFIAPSSWWWNSIWYVENRLRWWMFLTPSLSGESSFLGCYTKKLAGRALLLFSFREQTGSLRKRCAFFPSYGVWDELENVNISSSKVPLGQLALGLCQAVCGRGFTFKTVSSFSLYL